MEFEQQIETTKNFIHEVAVELGCPEDEFRAYETIKSVLQTIREILTPHESYQLIAQLPYYLKGIYVDGWKFDARERIRSISHFMDTFQDADGTPERDEIHSRENTLAVIAVMKKYVKHGEVRQLLDDFPAGLAELWVNDKTFQSIGNKTF